VTSRRRSPHPLAAGPPGHRGIPRASQLRRGPWARWVLDRRGHARRHHATPDVAAGMRVAAPGGGQGRGGQVVCVAAVRPPEQVGAVPRWIKPARWARWSVVK
jgi:hypothetical protein